MVDQVGPSQMGRGVDGQEGGGLQELSHWARWWRGRAVRWMTPLALLPGLILQRTVQKVLDHWKTKLSRHDHLLLTLSTTMVVEEEPFRAISWHQILKTAQIPF